MTMLAFGVAAFVGLHLIPYFGTSFRNKSIEKFGRNAYRGLFSLLVLISFAAIIFGWRGTMPSAVYDAPTWGYHVTPLFVLVGFILFFSSRAPTNIKRIVRHPQMTGLLLWGVGHLFSNGEDRSLVLFGGLSLWAIVAIIAANRRDGAWIKPEKQSFVKDAITVLIGIFLYLVFAYFHGDIIGVAAVPMAG